MWLDIVLLVLIVVCAFVGLFKGFFDSILSLFGNVVSLIIAYFLAKYVASFLNATFGVNTYIAKLLEKWGVNEGGLIGFSRDRLANIITLVLSIIIVWILLRLVIMLLSRIFSSVTDNSSTISGMNRLFGFLFGAIKGFVFVIVGFGLLSIIATFLPENNAQSLNSFLKKNPVTYAVYVPVANWTQENLKDKIDKALDQLNKDADSADTSTVETQTTTSNSTVLPIYQVVTTSPIMTEIHPSYLG